MFTYWVHKVIQPSYIEARFKNIYWNECKLYLRSLTLKQIRALRESPRSSIWIRSLQGLLRGLSWDHMKYVLLFSSFLQRWFLHKGDNCSTAVILFRLQSRQSFLYYNRIVKYTLFNTLTKGRLFCDMFKDFRFHTT